MELGPKNVKTRTGVRRTSTEVCGTSTKSVELVPKTVELGPKLVKLGSRIRAWIRVHGLGLKSMCQDTSPWS